VGGSTSKFSNGIVEKVSIEGGGDRINGQKGGGAGMELKKKMKGGDADRHKKNGILYLHTKSINRLGHT